MVQVEQLGKPEFLSRNETVGTKSSSLNGNNVAGLSSLDYTNHQ